MKHTKYAPSPLVGEVEFISGAVFENARSVI
jgi:hypothetical protein